MMTDGPAWKTGSWLSELAYFDSHSGYWRQSGLIRQEKLGRTWAFSRQGTAEPKELKPVGPPSVGVGFV